MFLVYRAKYGKSRQELTMPIFSQILSGILPIELIKDRKIKEWLSLIEKQYSKQSKMDRNEAKIQFLKDTLKLPTFGSTFFEVKQSTDPNYPELILVAINKNGLSLCHIQTKVNDENYVE